MSQENVEVARSSFEAFSRKDLAALRDRFFAPEIEWRAVTGVPFEGTYRGVDEVLRGCTDWVASFDDFSTQLEEVIDGGDRVVVCHRMRGRGKESGVEVDLALTQVVTVRGGKLVNITDYWTREDALEAVGLRE